MMVGATTRSVRNAVLGLLLVALAVPALSAQALPRATPEDVGFSSERLERLSDVLQAYVDDGRLAGAVALVARHGKVAFLESFGYRDLESRSPMREDAIFRIASQTKALVSVAVMILQEEGKLLIQDPVGKYMPEFMETTVAVATDDGGYEIVEADRPVTIRDLLTHTSGFGYGYGPGRDAWAKAEIQGWYFAHRDEPVAKTVARMAALPAEAQPGEQFVYGYSTDILGALVERVSGLTLDAFLRERIFAPLAMNDTHFYLPDSKTDRLATVYSSAAAGVERAPDGPGMETQGQYVEGPRKSYSGGAGLLSSAEDYAKFLQMMLDEGELDDTRILAPKTVELMTVDHIGDYPWAGGVGFGLGFSVLEDLGARGQPGTVGEFGWGGAYHSTYWVDPVEDMVVVYMTQLIPARRIDDHGKLRALVYQAILEEQEQ
jgi:CubicO group peptidase (beta-lactamase class C family)